MAITHFNWSLQWLILWSFTTYCNIWMHSRMLCEQSTCVWNWFPPLYKCHWLYIHNSGTGGPVRQISFLPLERGLWPGVEREWGIFSVLLALLHSWVPHIIVRSLNMWKIPYQLFDRRRLVVWKVEYSTKVAVWWAWQLLVKGKICSWLVQLYFWSILYVLVIVVGYNQFVLRLSMSSLLILALSFVFMPSLMLFRLSCLLPSLM